MKTKWILLAVAIILMAVNFLNADFSAYRQLSATDLVPVILIAAVIFFLKTGVISSAVIGIKKLWEKFRNK